MFLDARTVFCATLSANDPKPDEQRSSLAAPTSYDREALSSKLIAIFRQSGLAKDLDNALGNLIRKGNTVVIKPNWVHDKNLSDNGTECLITQTQLIESVIRIVARSRPGQIILGDAPIQACDFRRLLELNGIPQMIARLTKDGIAVSVRDFRLKTLCSDDLASRSIATDRTEADYVRFNLGTRSALEPITTVDSNFRVMMYDPRQLNQSHGKGHHEYLIAREVLEADVIVNLPKLKTHKKAGVTGALKNMVGINGLKDFLPHHRKGGSIDGGDCYSGRSYVKSLIEDALDAANMSDSFAIRRALDFVSRVGYQLDRFLGGDGNIEGSWSGNDTVWRMVLDLQRVLHYGSIDGRLLAAPQRNVLTITDAIIAGEGDGPLSSSPVKLGIITVGLNVAAVEYVNARLMRIEPSRIPLIRNAFETNDFPLSNFVESDIEMIIDGVPVNERDLLLRYSRPFELPLGWRGSCESGLEIGTQC